MWHCTCCHVFFRPVLVIGGSSDTDQESMGAFQEYPQVDSNMGSSSSFKFKFIILFILFIIQLVLTGLLF